MPISSGHIYFFARFCGHSLHWECGLKRDYINHHLSHCCHSLHWECGLKPSHREQITPSQGVTPFIGSVDWNWPKRLLPNSPQRSLPSLGVWIETLHRRLSWREQQRHSLHWECGLKPSGGCMISRCMKSLPSLGVWIETHRRCHESLGVCCHSLHWECGLKQPTEVMNTKAF